MVWSCSLELSLRLHWFDSRISPNKKFLLHEDSNGKFAYVDLSILDEIWKPDVFIPMTVNVRNPTVLEEPLYVK